MRDADRDRVFWERKATQYDRVAKGLFGRPLRRVLELMADGVSGADTVLEVGAATGLMTAVIAPRVRHVVATDYADNMLAVLRERMKDAGLSNVEWAHRDMYALGYAPASFDVVGLGTSSTSCRIWNGRSMRCATFFGQAASSLPRPSVMTRPDSHGWCPGCSSL